MAAGPAIAPKKPRFCVPAPWNRSRLSWQQPRAYRNAAATNEPEQLPEGERWRDVRHFFYAAMAAALFILLLTDVVLPLFFVDKCAKWWRIFQPVVYAAVRLLGPTIPEWTSEAMPRKTSGKNMKKAGKDKRSLQQQEEIPDRQTVSTIVMISYEKLQTNRKKQDDEEYQNFEAWLAQKRATQRAAAHAAHANTSTSSAQAPTASPDQLEQQAVTTIGDWLLNKAKEAAPVAADLSEPAATTPVNTYDAPTSSRAATSEDEAMDDTTTSRKRGREEGAAEGPRKQASTHATAATTTTAAAAPAASPSMRDDAASLTATPAVLLPQAASAGIVAAPPAAPVQRSKKNKRKARPKRRLPVREYETSAAEAPTAPRPLNTTVAVPRQCPGPLPAKDDFVTVVSKAAQRRARALEAAAVTIDPAVVGTALFRPSAPGYPGGSFSGSPRLTLAAALAKRPGVLAVRVNHRLNIVAADASTPTCLSELLAIRELGGVPVTARAPADRRSSTGFVYGVDSDLMNTELLAGITSAVPVLSATREGASVRLRFAEPLPPDRVLLLGLQLRVRHVRPRPRQCQQCGRFGHVVEACQRKGACIRCGRQHLEAESCKLRCVNCGGAYAADTPTSYRGGTAPTCPRWQEERRVATLMAVTPTPLSRRAVKAAVREESREVRSYAAAVKNKLLEGNTTDPGLQRPSPAPRRSLLPMASSPRSSLPAAPPAVPAEDPRDTLITNLLATLQAVMQFLPEEHPLRPPASRRSARSPAPIGATCRSLADSYRKQEKRKMAAGHGECSEEAAILRPSSMEQVHAFRGNNHVLIVIPRPTNEPEQLPEGDRWRGVRHFFYAAMAAALFIRLLTDVVLPLFFVDKGAKWWRSFQPVVSTVVFIVFLLTPVFAVKFCMRARRGYTCL
ncbi:hypothetical protein HPB52_008860 [Rhipicephalus sanguineus]|uniref:CCHC-type domain-containing protein n=1 Tax=Rhipicephalus sanguineus TaxID=34632 RepID=A0A9D4PV59_RHISA|nr:hypothetical protein HPB52_008860 [Rhipicephalus sanguineus]